MTVLLELGELVTAITELVLARARELLDSVDRAAAEDTDDSTAVFNVVDVAAEEELLELLDGAAVDEGAADAAELEDDPASPPGLATLVVISPLSM